MTTESTLQFKTAHWREHIRKNRMRTRIIISIYFAIYLCLGLLMDLWLYSTYEPYMSFSSLLISFLTLQQWPFITFLCLAVAGISLGITYLFHRNLMMLGTEYLEVIPNSFRNMQEQQLYHVIEEMKVAAALTYMPKVYIIQAEYMNAFASGLNEKSAMVAITQGLLDKLDRAELQAVMAHELSHIRHQDIKVTLMASVLSNLILMFIDFFFYNLVYSRNDKREQGNAILLLIITILRFVLPVLTVILSLYLSRTREYMADSGCVELMRDNQPLARALIKIHQDHQENIQYYQQEYGNTAHEDVRRAAYLYDPVSAGAEPVKSFASFFSTHPTLEQRLKAIGVTIKK